MTLIQDPSQRGLLELQNPRANFDVRPVQEHTPFFLSSRNWQGRSCLLKPAGPSCTHIQNQVLVHQHAGRILAMQGRLWSPSLPPRAPPLSQYISNRSPHLVSDSAAFGSPSKPGPFTEETRMCHIYIILPWVAINTPRNKEIN